MATGKQVFQAHNPTRWQRFKWGSRILVLILLIITVAIVIALRTLFQPDLPVETRVTKKILSEDLPVYKESELIEKYRGFRKFIDAKYLNKDSAKQNAVVNSNSALFPDSLGIRAAFYVAWDAQSFFSLRRNIDKLNLVIPEWFFFDPVADTLVVRMDRRGKEIIGNSKVKVMPMLTNNVNGVFRGDILHRVLHDSVKKEKLISALIREVRKNKFIGVNIDFEELLEEDNMILVNFQKELYARMKMQGLMVTQDVAPFNEDYNHKELYKYNDYLILMAYDQHADHSKPGPVSSQKWIEAAVDYIAKDIPSEKIILAMASYGYDWGANGKTETVTYQQALTLARESQAKVTYDNHTYNLYYTYNDENNQTHQVHFTDAATNFNTLRFATEYGLAGTAIWRMGSEDSRVWDFYNRSVHRAALKNFDFNALTVVESSDDVDYIGEGEILEVLSKPTKGHIVHEIDSNELLISEQRYEVLPSMFVVRKWGKTEAKKLVLTFDDGPDPKYTKQILDTLAKYKVPAVFFVVGLEAENNIPLVKRIYREGHEIGNHTFTHTNMATASRNRAILEMDLTQLLIECITGRSTTMFRAPYNADSQPETMEELLPVAISKERGYITVNENIDPLDWEKEENPSLNGDSIFNRVVRHVDMGNVILLHDAGGDRSATVEATGKIIRHFQAQGYQFTTIADLLGKTRDDIMPEVPKGRGYALLQLNLYIFTIAYYVGHFLFSLFLLFLILGTLRIIALAWLALKQRKKEKQLLNQHTALAAYPKVSIIVPAYNEEVNIVATIMNLLQCDYPNFDVILVDDGSKDNTLLRVKEVFANSDQVAIISKINGGKASALNEGIRCSNADYLVCIDADTKLKPDAVRMMMEHMLRDASIGAVAGTVKVGNQVNLMTRWQHLEYVTSQNFDRKAFAVINAITVVPGAIGAFRRTAIEEAGLFTTDTLAEDCDVTIRILRCGYIVANESRAIAYTEAPETIAQFMKQRVRWTFGVLQTIWKHKDIALGGSNKALSWIAIPDIIIFKYVIPAFTPLADVIALLSLTAGVSSSDNQMLDYYLLFLLVDTGIAAFAFLLEGEKLYQLILLIPQRLIYRWLMLVVLFQSLLRAVKGELQHWGVLKRTGNVKDLQINVSE